MIREGQPHKHRTVRPLNQSTYTQKRSQRAHIQGEKRKKGRTGIEPAAKAEPLPALSAVLHKVQVWGSPTSPSSRQVPKAEDQLHSTREFGQVLAKFLRQKTNSTVLPL